MLRSPYALRLPAALLLALLVARSARAESIEARARGLSATFLDGWLARHPEQATRLGDHARDGALPLLSRAALARDAAWYAAQGESLASLPLERLAPATRVDVLLLRARAGLEARAITNERSPERDPGYALEPLRVALSVPLRGFYAGSCSRGAALRTRLRAVPEYLRDARLALTEPSRAAVEAGLDRVADLLALCRESLPGALAGCRDSRTQAELAEADSMATAALTAYAAFLREDLLPHAALELPVDRAGLAERLAGVAGAPLFLDSLLARARAELSGLPDPPRTLSAGAGGGAAAAGDSASRNSRVDGESAQVMLDEIRARLRRDGRVRVETDDRVAFGDFSPPNGEPARVTVGPWDSRGTRTRLDLGPRKSTGTGALAGDPSLARADAELLLAGEGLPGHALFAIRESAIRSRPRQALGIEAIRDGWSRYAETLWLEGATGARGDSLRRRHDHLERERLARSIAELMSRVEGASVDSTRRWLERVAGLTTPEAWRAAREAAAAPRWMASTIALWGIRELRAAAEHGSGSEFSPIAFHDALMAEGAVPLGWTREFTLRKRPAKHTRP